MTKAQEIRDKKAGLVYDKGRIGKKLRKRDGWESNVDTDAYGWDWTRRHGDNAIVAYRVLA